MHVPHPALGSMPAGGPPPPAAAPTRPARSSFLGAPSASVGCYLASAVACVAGTVLLLRPRLMGAALDQTLIDTVLALGCYALSLTCAARGVARWRGAAADAVSLALLACVFWPAAGAALDTWSMQWAWQALAVGLGLAVVGIPALAWGLRPVLGPVPPPLMAAAGLLLAWNANAGGLLGWAWIGGDPQAVGLVWDAGMALLVACLAPVMLAALGWRQGGRSSPLVMLAFAMLWLVSLGHAMLGHHMHLDLSLRPPVEGLALLPLVALPLVAALRHYGAGGTSTVLLGLGAAVLGGGGLVNGSPGAMTGLAALLVPALWALAAWRWRSCAAGVVAVVDLVFMLGWLIPVRAVAGWFWATARHTDPGWGLMILAFLLLAAGIAWCALRARRVEARS